MKTVLYWAIYLGIILTSVLCLRFLFPEVMFWLSLPISLATVYFGPKLGRCLGVPEVWGARRDTTPDYPTHK